MVITYDKSLQMRGLGIMMICLHNFIHNIFYIRECEFAFYPSMVEKISSIHSIGSWDAFSLFFSFWGWYGIVAFMFFSGYGLVLKYEHRGAPLHFWPYLKRNYVKLMLLMFIPWVLCFQTVPNPCTILILQLTYTINFFMPQSIIPGVFWYFGLTLQFYILYMFLYHHRSNRWLWWVSVVVTAVALVFALLPPTNLHIGLRNNSPFWLPLFLLGVWFARGGNESRLMRLVEDHRWLSCLMLFCLWGCSTVVRVLWVFSPLLFLVLLIALFHTRKEKEKDKEVKTSGIILVVWGWVQRCLVFLGRISPGIFVCHPVVRMYANKAFLAGYYLPLITLVYVAVVIIAAMVYTPLYKKSLPRVLKWLKLD